MHRVRIYHLPTYCYKPKTHSLLAQTCTYMKLGGDVKWNWVSSEWKFKQNWFSYSISQQEADLGRTCVRNKTTLRNVIKCCYSNCVFFAVLSISNRWYWVASHIVKSEWTYGMVYFLIYEMRLFLTHLWTEQ